MAKLILVFLLLIPAFAADNDPWAKVQELKSGTELRIIRHGSPKPLLATFEELHETSLVVATKKEEIAIPKDEIDRIDYRPARTGSRVTKETKTTETAPDYSGPDTLTRSARPSESSSTSFNLGGSKPDFETIYRRTASMPANK